MDQETHDAAVRTVIAGLRQTSSDKRVRGPADFALALAAVEMEASLSPPAKPEAKLEALPTMEDWRQRHADGFILSSDQGVSRRFSALAEGIAAGAVKIVDERGKGAEAERLAPCPVNGCGRQPVVLYERNGEGHQFPRYACYVPGGMHVTTAACLGEPEARKAWNKAFERAERFPGER